MLAIGITAYGGSRTSGIRRIATKQSAPECCGHHGKQAGRNRTPLHLTVHWLPSITVKQATLRSCGSTFRALMEMKSA
jgi:hypothetical protein